MSLDLAPASRGVSRRVSWADMDEVPDWVLGEAILGWAANSEVTGGVPGAAKGEAKLYRGRRRDRDCEYGRAAPPAD